MRFTINSLWIFIFTIALLTASCHSSRKASGTDTEQGIVSHVKIRKKVEPVAIDVGEVTASELINYAESLIGVKYKPGSADIEKGFDCSGFIWFVFNHFNIKVPRVSEQFTNAGNEVPIKESKRGDLILFTGSDSKSGVVGHMGLITENRKNKITFIHSASGGDRGVSKTQMNTYFIERFVKVNRVFND
jgi:cell wall-associated NlpC family hydrolase